MDDTSAASSSEDEDGYASSAAVDDGTVLRSRPRGGRSMLVATGGKRARASLFTSLTALSEFDAIVSTAKSKAQVMEINVIRTTTLPTSTWVRHPLVRLHFLDRRTGAPLAKPRGETAKAAVAALEREMRLEIERKVKLSTAVSSSVAPASDSDDDRSGSGDGDSSDADSNSDDGDAAAAKAAAKAAKKKGSALRNAKAKAAGTSAGTSARQNAADIAMAAQSADVWFRPSECQRVAAVMSKPAELVDGAAVWNDHIAVNVTYRHFLQPHVVVLFELLDYGVDLPASVTRASGGFLRLAWGFLHPLPTRSASRQFAVLGKGRSGQTRAERRLAEERRLDAHASDDEEGEGEGGESEAKAGDDAEADADADVDADGEAAKEGGEEGGDGVMNEAGEADAKDGEGEEDEDEEDEDGNSTSRKGGKRRNASGKGSKQRRSLAHKRHARTRRGEKTNLGLNLRVQLWKWPPAFERSRWSSLHGEADRIGLDLHAIPDVFLAYQQKKAKRERFESTLIVSMHGGLNQTAIDVAQRPRTPFEREVAPPAAWPPSEEATGDGAEGGAAPPVPESRARMLARRRAALGDERLPCMRGKSACAVPTVLRHRLTTSLAGSFGCSALAFSPDGTLLAGACLARGGPGDGRYPIYIWGVVEGSLRCVLGGHTGIVHHLEWTAAGELVSCSADTTLRLWTLTSPSGLPGAGAGAGEESAEIVVGAAGSEATGLKALCGLQRLALAHPCFVYGCAVHPRSKPERPIIVSCGYERNLWLWDGASGEAIAEALPQKPEKFQHNSHVNCVVFTDQPRMYSGDAEGEVHIWRTKGDGDKADDYSLVYVIKTGMPSILSLSPHPTQPKMLVLAPGDGGLCMYRTNRKYNQDSTFERCGGLSTDSVRVSAVLSPDGRFALSGSIAGRAIVWKTSSGRQSEDTHGWAAFDGAESSGATASPAAMNCVAWSPVEHAVAIGGIGPPGSAPPVLIYSK